MMKNYLIGTNDNPYHFSVGAVVLNNNDEVVCHYFKKAPDGAPGEYRDIDNVYLLMRETPEPGEAPEETLRRGLLEEFGVVGETLGFLGAQQGIFKGDNTVINKTTIYFLVRLLDMDISKRDKQDAEGESEIVFLPMDVCIERMEDQWNRLHLETLNEAEIIRRAAEYLK